MTTLCIIPPYKNYMDKEDFCTFKDKECTQTPKPFCEEGRSVWSHLVGLTCENPNDPNYLEPGSDSFYRLSPEEWAKTQSDIRPIGHSCWYCRKRLEGVLEIWKEIADS